MTYWIADLCTNWKGDKGLLCELAQQACDAGFGAVKVQYVRPEAMWREGDPRREQWAKYVLTLPDMLHLSEITVKNYVDFGASVFAVEDCEPMSRCVDWLKVASCESMWDDLVREVSSRRMPWIISTPPGWGYPGWLYPPWRTLHPPWYMLHCVPTYPCPKDGAKLSNITRIRTQQCGPATGAGYSDHTGSADVVRDAVLEYGAQAVELHYSGDLADCPEIAHSWSTKKFKGLVAGIRGEIEARAVEACKDEFWERVARKDGWRQ